MKGFCLICNQKPSLGIRPIVRIKRVTGAIEIELADFRQTLF